MLAVVFSALDRSLDRRAQLAIGLYMFTILLLFSMSIGVFFFFSIGKAVLAFIGISIVGAVVLTLFDTVLVRKFFPGLFKTSGGE